MLQGGVIAYPTEAVWGLGCDPFNVDAVNKLLSIKKRSVDKGLILIAAEISQFDFILKDCTAEQLNKMASTWPGPTTWLVPNNKSVPYWVTGDHKSVALRVSNHPVVKALCNAFRGPIISSSANPQAKPSAKTAWQVSRYFHRCKDLSYICKGTVGTRKKPSDIFDLISGSAIRI